jgi:hypothetical protein
VKRWLLAVSLLGMAMLTHAQATLRQPSAIATDSAGNVYIADASAQQVFEIPIGAAAIVIAGTGTQGFSGDGGAAIAARLNSRRGLAIAADGTVYIADTGNQRIRAIRAGILTTIAGTGVAGFSGDTAAATTAALCRPAALAIAADASLLVADSCNQRIRRIDAAGIITTVAGNGTQGFGGDNGAALTAEFNQPLGLALDSSGNLLVADTQNNRIRRIDSTGRITTLAGNGIRGFSGDGGPAAAASLSHPTALAYSGTTLLIADADNQRIRAVSASGLISTVAGSSAQGYSADASPAVTAQLNAPRSVAAASDSSPLLADTRNMLVREVAANGALYTLPLNPALGASSELLTLTAPATLLLGSGTATATLTASAPAAQGMVTLLDSGTAIATSTLSQATATWSLSSLPSGTHTLTAMYSGDLLHPSVSSGPISVIVTAGAATVTLAAPSTLYAGLPATLTATVHIPAGALASMATGTLTFFADTALIGTSTVVNNAATAVWLAPTAGAHTLTTMYSGDSNFTAATAPSIIATVSSLPDFTLTASTPSQTSTAGSLATYAFNVAPSGGAFTGAVTFSVAGLPAGATASFSPATLVPGITGAQTVMVVQLPSRSASLEQPVPPFDQSPGFAALAACFCLLGVSRCRRKRPAALLSVMCMLILVTLGLTGCGARTAGTSSPPQVYTLTLTATSTNLAGSVVAHTATVQLIEN